MDLPDHASESIRTEVWRPQRGSIPALLVEVSAAFDAVSAQVDRAALAAMDALDRQPKEVEAEDALHAVTQSISAALFPLPSIWADADIQDLRGLYPLPVAHAWVTVDYQWDAITIKRGDPQTSRYDDGDFQSQAAELMQSSDPSKDSLLTVVRGLSLLHLWKSVLHSAHRLSEAGFSDYPNQPLYEAEALRAWGIHPRIQNPKSWVYFIRRGERGPIKIGWSKSPVGRLAQLQTGQEVKLVLLATAPGGSQEEAALHDRFAATRMVGEWFRPTPWLCGYVRKVIATGVL